MVIATGYHRVMTMTVQMAHAIPLCRSGFSLLAACVVSLAAGCASAPVPAPPTPGGSTDTDAGSVLLISVDALSPAALDSGWVPNIARLGREGVRAAWMTPSYPSLTFPNHYTLVTGLHPEQHGITHNTMEDAALGRFRISDDVATGDARWWNAAEPLWVTAENAGLPTATFFWPGSGASIRGVRPRRWHVFDDAVSIETRVDTVVSWYSETAATRPRFATLYFEHLDKAAHDHGPRSTGAREAAGRIDTAIGRLVDALRVNGVLDSVHIVIVSDHGMAEVPPTQVLSIEDMVDPADARPVTDGQSVGFAPLPGRTGQAEARLLGAHRGYDCWRKAELPARWHYRMHPRVPPIVCQMHEGFDALSAERKARRKPGVTRGSHGYDPALASMRAVFVARGPRLRPGATVAGFENVDVYPLLARLIGVTPQPNAGDASRFDAVLVGSGER